MASRPDCEDDAGRQDAYQAPHMAGGSGLVPAFTGGQMPGWQGEQWMHPGAALAGWEVPSGWEAASSAGYAIPYGMPPQQQQLLQLQPQLQTQTRGGVIFLCDSQTEDECLQRGLFGMPASQTQIVRQIAPEATLLFLFNVRARPAVVTRARAARCLRSLTPSRLSSGALPPWRGRCGTRRLMASQPGVGRRHLRTRRRRLVSGLRTPCRSCAPPPWHAAGVAPFIRAPAARAQVRT
eukprot:1266720-Prymnesium_polylepis.1